MSPLSPHLVFVLNQTLAITCENTNATGKMARRLPYIEVATGRGANDSSSSKGCVNIENLRRNK